MIFKKSSNSKSQSQSSNVSQSNKSDKTNSLINKSKESLNLQNEGREAKTENEQNENEDKSNKGLKILSKLEMKTSKKKINQQSDKFSQRDDEDEDGKKNQLRTKIFGNDDDSERESNSNSDKTESDNENEKEFKANIFEKSKGKNKDLSENDERDDSIANIKKSFTGSDSINDSEKKDKFGNDSESGIENGNEKLPLFQSIEDIEEYFRDLRQKYKQKEKDGTFDSDKIFEDPEFPCDRQLFERNGEMPKRMEGLDIEFERPSNLSDQTIDAQKIEFFATDSSHNINFQYKIKRGLFNDKFFIGCIMMLFKAKEEYLSNLVIDYENVNDNIKYGFCGFQFFINGEWKYVIIDTRLPTHQTDELVVSCAVSNKTTFWLSLLCKAYSKIYNSYDVLSNASIKNVLVDLTGGTSKKIEIPQAPQIGGIGNQAITDSDKKYIFEELRRCIQQNYLIGCTKEEDVDEDEMDDSQSDNNEEEEIIINSMYVILDVQDIDGLKLIYLNNSWGKGKWSGSYGPEDENWETNKGLKEKLGYENQADGTFWMLFNEFLDKFENIYYCRIYPQSWHQFCIPGKWNNLTSGGAPIFPSNKEEASGNTNANPYKKHNSYASENVSIKKGQLTKMTSIMSGNKKSIDMKNNEGKGKKAELKYKEVIKRVILPESDDRWFLNPQYKLEIKPNTKLIISLMQEDERLSGQAYQNCNFMIMLCSGKYTRVWELKEENIIKTAVSITSDSSNEYSGQVPNREIVAQVDYNEILRKLAIKKKKKVLTRQDVIYINLIPYIEFTNKYEIEKNGPHGRIFKPLYYDGIYYLRLFSSEPIKICELPRPYEVCLDQKWNNDNSGGRRFISDNTSSNKLIENPFWPINPQFLIRFDSKTSIKLIIRKTNGTFNSESKVGMMITKPDVHDSNICPLKNLKATGEYLKSDIMKRILESTEKILDSKKQNPESIHKKLMFNLCEWVVESKYVSSYSASLFHKFNKIDSPILIIPSMENHGDCFEFKFSGKIYII